MRSIFAKNFEVQSGENKPEEDFQNIPLDTASGNIVMEHFTTLKELDGIHGIMESELEKAVQASDAFKLCEVFEQISPYVTLIRQGGYDHDVPFAPVSIGKRVSLAEKINGVCNDAASKVASTVYVKFDDRKKEYDSLKNSIGEFPRAMSIRADMDSVAESYGALKKSFGSKVSRPGIDLHLERMPKINELRGELLKIATMLETDQSRNNFADLKRGKRDISGIVFSGRIRKDAANLGYDEGVLLCDELKKQIDQYIKECPQVIRTIDYLDNEKAAIEGVVGLLGAVSAPDMDSASVFDTAQKLLFPKDKAPSQKYSFLLSKYDRNQDLRKQAGARYERKSGEICEKANSILNSVKELPEPQTLDDIDKSLDLIQSTMPQIRNCKAVFDVLENFNESEGCIMKVGELEVAFDKRLAEKKQYEELSQKVDDAMKKKAEADQLFTNPAAMEVDLNAALELIRMPLLVFPASPLYRELKEKYENFSIDLKKKVHEKAVTGIGSIISLYESAIQLTNNPDADAEKLRARIGHIKNTAIPLVSKYLGKSAPVTTNLYADRLEKAVQNFDASLGIVEQAGSDRNELKRRISLLSDALESCDHDKIEMCARWADDFKPNQYTADMAGKYSLLLKHIRNISGAIAMQAGASAAIYAHPSLDRSKSDNVTFFNYVGSRMGVPKSKTLGDMRIKLITGESVHTRLSALAEGLVKASETALCDDDKRWVAELGDRFKRDIADGYLSHAREFHVRPETLDNIKGFFDRYVA